MGVVLNESFRTTVIKEWASGPCYPKGKGWIQESPRFTHRVKWPRIWPCQYSSFRSKSPSTVSRFHLTVAWYIQEIKPLTAGGLRMTGFCKTKPVYHSGSRIKLCPADKTSGSRGSSLYPPDGETYLVTAQTRFPAVAACVHGSS